MDRASAQSTQGRPRAQGPRQDRSLEGEPLGGASRLAEALGRDPTGSTIAGSLWRLRGSQRSMSWVQCSVKEQIMGSVNWKLMFSVKNINRENLLWTGQ